ncbi:hypothetical protein DPMN_163561 [Dreissena polymorpha]|uniref:Uncharacterized protein n=1 Tax=Dreissena polymorpha TaxID=45954 RepID=A0A9D4EW09_DREPO|nr:hypothetical protein DPMN_163561 [Dreissena polymorpha]
MAVTGVMGTEDGWYERERCRWCHGQVRRRLVYERALSLVSSGWKKKVSLRGSAVTGIMGMEEEGWYEMEGCDWCHGNGIRRLV